MKLLERTRCCNVSKPSLNIQFAFPFAVSSSRFIIVISFFFFSKGERGKRWGGGGDIQPRLDSDRFERQNVFRIWNRIEEGYNRGRRDGHANHRDGKREFTPIILVAFARRDALGTSQRKRCRLSLMNRNGMLMAAWLGS